MGAEFITRAKRRAVVRRLSADGMSFTRLCMPSPSRQPIPGRFAGKVVIVTGATHGIGFAIALELLREGADVVVSGLAADRTEGEAAFAAAGFSPLLLAGDLAEEAFCREIVAQT